MPEPGTRAARLRRLGGWTALLASMVVAAFVLAEFRARAAFKEAEIAFGREAFRLAIEEDARRHGIAALDTRCAVPGIQFRVYSTGPGPADMIEVSIPGDAVPGVARLSASEFGGFEVEGRYRRSAGLRLDANQRRAMASRVRAAIPGPDTVRDAEMLSPSASRHMEACIDGTHHYGASLHPTDEPRNLFTLEGAVLGILRAKRRPDPAAELFILM